MNNKFVIAKDADNRPLKRLVVAERDRIVYLVDHSLLAVVESGESWPVGFPDEFVYVFDSIAFSEMERRLKESKEIPRELWQKLIPYRPNKWR